MRAFAPFILLTGLLHIVAAWKYSDVAVPDGDWQFLSVASRWKASSQSFPASQWSVNVTRDGLVTFVLPIKGTIEELGFVRNQLHSFDTFLAHDGLREIIILCPSDDLQQVTTFVHNVQHSLARLQQFIIRVVPEGLCAPELLPISVYAPHFPKWPGWMRQQAIKLAAADLVDTPFMLILDADIYLGRHLRPIDLMASGPCSSEPVCDVFRDTFYKGIIAGVEMKYGDDYHRRWFTNSAAVTLQLDVNFSEWNMSLGVTPQVISTDIARSLGGFIERRFDVPSWRAYLFELATAWAEHQLVLKGRWEHDPAWTEWALYHVFGLHTERFYDYQAEGRLFQGNEVWFVEAFEAWDPCRDVASPTAAGYFSLVQSRIGKSADDIFLKLQACWQSLGATKVTPNTMASQVTA